MKSICEDHTFNEIHSQHVKGLRNFLFYKLGDLEKAKDFTQEAFVRLWNNCSKVSLEKVKSYLFTIGNRLFLDHVDHQKVVLKFQYRSEVSELQNETNPEYLYQAEEFKNRLEEAVSDLPENQRVTFLMSRIDKMKNREIADELGISIKTVEKHISLSVQTLKSRLDEVSGLKI